MRAEWYYVEHDETVGPVTLDHLVSRCQRTPDETPLVWTQGMTEWTDASAVPAISHLLHAGSLVRDQTQQSLLRRARHELIEYLKISGYLFICFGALLFYKAAILRSEGIEFAVVGIALVKALILGKFILALHAIGVGERGTPPGSLLVDIMKRSFFFLMLLVALNIIEELIMGYFHGRSGREVFAEMAGGTLLEAIAVCFLLLLILIPYFAFRGLASRLGDGILWKHFTERGGRMPE